jgi:hypothetical protein
MESKGFYINDLPQSGEVTFLAAVIEKELRPKRNGGSFLSVRLADRSGEIDAKAWDNPETVAQLFDCNDVVKVPGSTRLAKLTFRAVVRLVSREPLIQKTGVVLRLLVLVKGELDFISWDGFPARKSRLAAAAAWKEKAAAWQANAGPLVTLLTGAGRRSPPALHAERVAGSVRAPTTELAARFKARAPPGRLPAPVFLSLRRRLACGGTSGTSPEAFLCRGLRVGGSSCSTSAKPNSHFWTAATARQRQPPETGCLPERCRPGRSQPVIATKLGSTSARLQYRAA